jgi:uncharacterized glyoxalase superfamily protein PhnB
MELVQSRIVTDDVQRLAAFYARLLRAQVVLNDYYVEVPAGAMSVGFSRRRFTEYREHHTARSSQAEIILDFQAADVDAEYQRILGLGVDWLATPATQPWGNRSMTFRDPAGNPVNVFSPPRALPAFPAVTHPLAHPPLRHTAHGRCDSRTMRQNRAISPCRPSAYALCRHRQPIQPPS